MITVLHREVYPNEYNVTWGPGGRGPSPPQRAVIRNVLTNPYRSLFGAKEIEVDGGVRVGVVGGDQGGGGEGGEGGEGGGQH